MLEEAWSKKEVFKLPEPINPNNFEHGKLIDPSGCKFTPQWSYSIPDWDNLKGKKRDRFLDSPMLWTQKNGAELTFEFFGTVVGAYMVSGPDAGIVEISIDGGPSLKYDLYHKKFSKGLHYPQTIIFANDLNEGKHTLHLKMLKESSGTGNVMRIMYFVVN